MSVSQEEDGPPTPKKRVVTIETEPEDTADDKSDKESSVVPPPMDTTPAITSIPMETLKGENEHGVLRICLKWLQEKLQG